MSGNPGAGRIDVLAGLEREDIEAVSDPAALERWYRVQVDLMEDIKGSIAAHQYAGTAEHDWLIRAGGKVAHLRRQARWVLQRMLDLGISPPAMVGAPGWSPVGRLERRIEVLAGRLAAAEAALAAIRGDGK